MCSIWARINEARDATNVKELLRRKPEEAFWIWIVIDSNAECAEYGHPGELGAIESSVVVQIEVPEIVGLADLPFGFERNLCAVCNGEFGKAAKPDVFTGPFNGPIGVSAANDTHASKRHDDP